MTIALANRTRLWLFIAAALTINILDPLLVRTVHKPQVGIAAAFDLGVLVPALYYWLVLRGGIQPLVMLVPVGFLALFRAAGVLPGFALARPVLAAGAEVAFLTVIVTRTRRSLRATQGGDVLERMRAVALDLLRLPAVAAFAATEMAILYYALASWRSQPEVPPGMQAYSIHERAGTAFLLGALAGVSVVEAPLVHLVVMRWSVTTAWVLTAISLYGATWLAGMARAFVLRPVLVGDGELVIRSGLMWTVRAPLDRIATVRGGDDPGALRLPRGGDPNVVIEFREPVLAQRMFGVARPVTCVALALDEPAGFERALTAAGKRWLRSLL